MLREWARRIVDRVVRGSVARRLAAEGVSQRLDALGERQSRDIAARDAREARSAAVMDERMAQAERRIAAIETRALSVEMQAAALGTALREFSQAITAVRQQVNRSAEKMHSPLLAGRALSLLRLLSPRDPVGARFARFGRERDGGYILVESLLPEGAVCYSIGISDDVSWDKAMAARGHDVFQYDHTLAGPPESDPRFHFAGIGVGAAGTDSVVLRPLDRMLADNQHLDRRDLILKMDVEGAEWDVFATLPSAALGCFAQIAVEFHLLDQLDDAEHFEKMSRVLRRLRGLFVPVHIHANNYVDVIVFGGLAVPPVMEVTYVRSDLTETVPGTRIFPTELDRPNYPDRAELFLGRFQFGDEDEARDGLPDRPRG